MYTEVITLKKAESITFRTDAVIKKALITISKEKKWSLSQLSEEIIRDWLQEHYPELMQEEP